MRWPLLAAAGLLVACHQQPHVDRSSLQQEVIATERAFAQSMAQRDRLAFNRFLSDEAVFFSGDRVLRGKPQVAAAWQRFFPAAQAPFSWEPEQVEVLDSGTLAMSSGPVRNAQGRVIARFSSIWRREAPGQWRIIFDHGSEVCEASSP